jgi:3',5'-nucleoside bisphosphate phosphatase
LPAQKLGLAFVPGVEISVTWPGPQQSKSTTKPPRDTTIHIVGLGIDIDNPILQAGLKSIRDGRISRARIMADDFKSIGIQDMLEGALSYCDNPEMIGRTHFARHLVALGYASDVSQVFNRFLTFGKLGYVAHQWASLDDAIAWIHAAGGAVVLAHPGRYKITSEDVEALVAEFKAKGGDAIEVVTGSHTREQYQTFARFARKYALDASRGADFHSLGESPFKPGELPALQADLTPVWRGAFQARLHAKLG